MHVAGLCSSLEMLPGPIEVAFHTAPDLVEDAKVEMCRRIVALHGNTRKPDRFRNVLLHAIAVVVLICQIGIGGRVVMADGAAVVECGLIVGPGEVEHPS